jgi:hypothetical protein
MMDRNFFAVGENAQAVEADLHVPQAAQPLETAAPAKRLGSRFFGRRALHSSASVVLEPAKGLGDPPSQHPRSDSGRSERKADAKHVARLGSRGACEERLRPSKG